MPKAYFEPENLNALAEVFSEAKRRLNSQDFNDLTRLDLIAARILRLAAEGVPAGLILREIFPQAEARSTPELREESGHPREKHRTKVSNRIRYLREQADRARKLAAESGSPLVVELYEIHARECERKAESQRIRGKQKPPVHEPK